MGDPKPPPDSSAAFGRLQEQPDGQLALLCAIAPAVWLLVGILPTIWGFSTWNRYEDKGPGVSIAVGLVTTVLLELTALTTLVSVALGKRRLWSRWLASAGQIVLVICSLIAWGVVVKDRVSDAALLLALTVVSVGSAILQIYSAARPVSTTFPPP